MRQNDAYNFHRIMMVFDVLFLGAPITQHNVSVYVITFMGANIMIQNNAYNFHRMMMIFDVVFRSTCYTA